MTSDLSLKPITITDAKPFISRLHRHNLAPLGGLFAVSVVDNTGEIRGVAVFGRPVARRLQDGYTGEITRSATDGCHNANSMLYGACLRAARALGYRRVYTYTLAEESGASVRAVGFRKDADVKPADTWSCRTRLRCEVDLFGKRRPTGPKTRWIWERPADLRVREWPDVAVKGEGR